MRAVRVGVVGLGAMGRNHVRVWRELDGARLVGVADADPLTRNRVSSFHGVPGYRTLSELIAHESIDALSIATPTSGHKDATLLACEAGVHVLIEKPLAPDPDEARTIRAVVEQSGVVAMVGHIERFNPALIEMGRLLREGVLGEVFAFSARRVGPFPPRVKDVGVTFDIATHDLDQAQHLLARPIVSLYARAGRRVHEVHEDLVSIVGSTDDGVVLTFEINWLTPRKQRETLVLGQAGMLVADTITQDLFFYKNNWKEGTWLRDLRGVDEGDMTRFALRRVEPLRAELEAFLAAVQSGTVSEATVQDGVMAIELADAVLRSLKSGQPTVLTPVAL